MSLVPNGSSAISKMKMAIGDIRPQEVHATKVEAPQVAAVPNSADNSDAEVQHTPAANQQGGSAVPPT